jgi:uncharacterized phage protein (TIGR01671 family)
MREILFRAWDRNKKMMEKVVDIQMLSPYVYTNVIVEFKEHGRIINDNHLVGGTDGCDTAILMQYTGLKDKNGKKIFEGDILGYKRLGTGKVIATGVVEFSEEGRYAIRDFDLNLDMVVDAGNFVIGNIYENPDAFKEVNDEN